MPFEKGGRADKQGNKYEINCIIYEILKILDETNYDVIVEALGADEIGTDILVTTFDGQKEHQQCKARNASKEYWDISDLKAKDIFSTWKVQLNRDNSRRVSLVSPMVCSFLFDLHNRACNTSDKVEDFYSIQIMKSSKEFQKFYKSFCVAMDLDCDKDVDVLKSIDYLKRIFYKQISEYELQERVNQNIQYLFSSEPKVVYNALLSFVVAEDILGKQITQSVLCDYFIKQGIVLRLKDGDKRIAPRITEINREYRENFRVLQGGLIHREEFDDCIKAIENEKSTIISGSAGYGKSGCTEAILNYCEEKKLPYIAVKLDRRIPHKNCEIWGQELGLPGSIVHSIHCISRNENAVIILDQLDALRWTQANSSEALAVCMELIRQVEYLNCERKKKIIIIFVCRTYDLENDNNINSLFKKKETVEDDWKIVKVEDFNEDVIFNNVIFSRKQYIAILRNQGILERWYSDPKKKIVVFNLLQSITPDLDNRDISFIKKHAFSDRNDDEQFMRCFLHDIVEESAEMFELRMMFYEHYPEYAKEIYIDAKSMMKQFETRTIRLISFWLQNKIKSQGRYVYRYEEELVDSEDSFLIDNGEAILNEFLPYIPKESGWEIKYGDWSGKYAHKSGIERACVCLVKKATLALCGKSPERFWEYYEPYMGQGYHVFNEIILTGLAALSSLYSNRIMRYLSNDVDKNGFDYTSGAEDELGLIKEVLKIHGNNCDEEELMMAENSICQYISPNASEWYKRRIKQNRQKEYVPAYWSFWGDLQYELLQCLPEERISTKTKELLRVLDRRFHKVSSCYCNKNGHSGWVKSPISNKNISKRQWLQIITNSKLKNRGQHRWVEVKGGFIESSYEAYASDFQSAVKQHPQEMINLVLENKERILPVFVDSLFLGVEVSEKLEKVDFSVIEKLLLEFPCDMKSHRASYFCGIIEKMSDVNWSSEVMEQLINIALNHCNPELDKPNVTNLEDKEMKSCDMLHSNALNCVRGNAARAIGHLLWEDRELFSSFKDIIDELTKDENPAVRFASLYVLWPSYNIDREWAGEKIMYLYESDIRMACFYDSRNMFFLLYPEYKERVINIIKNCFESEDKQLVKMGGYAVCEFYIRQNEFETIVTSVESRSEEQIKAILDMAVIYLEVNDYREVAKDIILTYKSIDMDVEFPLSKMFYDKYVDVKNDREFLREFMKTRVSRRTVRAFVHYLEEDAVSIVDYADIILQLCENILQMEIETLRKQWGIEDEISKLIISLYDETANSSKMADKQIAGKCLDLWDIMFERQFGSVREVSRKLMER